MGNLDEHVHAAVSAANVPVLLMVLFQLTGDRRWLKAPYTPSRPRGLGEHMSGGLPDRVQRKVREAAVDALRAWASGTPVAVPDPPEALLVEMMSICMGEAVPQEYGPLISAEMDHKPLVPSPEAGIDPAKQSDFSVLIIGAGISGLVAAVGLRQAGIPFTVLEKNVDLGGTWWENRYPGCGVDTPSHLYSFSAFPRHWSTHFGKRDEVLGYLHDMAEHFEILPFVRLRTEVLGAAYDADAQYWKVRTRDSAGREQEMEANFLISAVGLLNRPKIPNLPGVNAFHGPIFHSARWPDDLDLTGKRVAIVGTGASSMQIMPAIVDEAAQVTVFQRSPQWVAPSENYFGEVGDDLSWLIENVPFYHQWYRLRLAWTVGDRLHQSLQVDPEWPHPARSLNSVNEGHRRFFTRYLSEQLKGREDLQKKALPRYPPFGKRMLLDNGWFAALKRSNVELVTDPVVEVTETGVRTSSGAETTVDVIVLATGFHAQNMLYPMDIRGRGGTSLREVWGEDDATAYLGMTVPGFPNFLIMYGPNSNPSSGSYFFIAECQMNYLVQLIKIMIEHDLAAVECRQDVCENYNGMVDEANSHMVWTHPGMENYYRNAAGRVVTNSPWRVLDYWNMTRIVSMADFIVSPKEGVRDVA